jgi:hypothetical protein
MMLLSDVFDKTHHHLALADHREWRAEKKLKYEMSISGKPSTRANDQWESETKASNRYDVC